MVVKTKREPADKPGSVVGNHSSGITVTSILKRPTRRRRGPRHSLPIWSCSRWGLPCRKLLPVARCALTAPFHPYLPTLLSSVSRRYIFCCTFRRLAPPRRYLAPCPMEPGLSSLPHMAETRLPGRLSRLLSSTLPLIDSAVGWVTCYPRVFPGWNKWCVTSYAPALPSQEGLMGSYKTLFEKFVDFSAWHVVQLGSHPRSLGCR